MQYCCEAGVFLFFLYSLALFMLRLNTRLKSSTEKKNRKQLDTPFYFSQICSMPWVFWPDFVSPKYESMARSNSPHMPRNQTKKLQLGIHVNISPLNLSSFANGRLKDSWGFTRVQWLEWENPWSVEELKYSKVLIDWPAAAKGSLKSGLTNCTQNVLNHTQDSYIRLHDYITLFLNGVTSRFGHLHSWKV